MNRGARHRRSAVREARRGRAPETPRERRRRHRGSNGRTAYQGRCNGRETGGRGSQGKPGCPCSTIACRISSAHPCGRAHAGLRTQRRDLSSRRWTCEVNRGLAATVIESFSRAPILDVADVADPGCQRSAPQGFAGTGARERTCSARTASPPVTPSATAAPRYCPSKNANPAMTPEKRASVRQSARMDLGRACPKSDPGTSRREEACTDVVWRPRAPRRNAPKK